MNPKQLPSEVKIDTTGALHVAWDDTQARSGIDYIELKRFAVDTSYRDPAFALTLHIVEQAKQIEVLNRRLSKLEDLLERLGGAFKES